MSTSEDTATLLTCEFCGEDVVSEDDYCHHLKLAHNFTKDIPLILGRAVKKIAKPEDQQEIEEIIIDDDEDMEDEVINNVSVYEENIDKEQIENQISDFVQEMFKDLNVMIDGFLPEDFDVKDNNEDITKTKVLGDISSCFDDLKSFVGNLEIPSDFAEFFSNSYDKTEFDSATPSSSTNQTDKRVIPKPEPGQTLYLCQVEKCSFYATKDGYKNGTAAKHLKEAHKIKGTDMVGGKFKFQKIKGERLNKK